MQGHPGSPRARAGSTRAQAIAGLVFIAVILAAAGLLAADLRASAVRDTERGLLSLTTLLSEQADKGLQAIETIQAAVIDDIMAPSARTEAAFVERATSFVVQDRLKTRVAALPQVSEVAVLDTGGRLLSSSRAWPTPDADAADRFVFARVAAEKGDRMVVVVPGALRPDNRLTVVIVHRILGGEGQGLGWVLGVVDFRYFEALYARVSPDAADVLSIVHQDGTMLARHPGRPGAIGRIVPPLPFARSVADDPSGSGMGRMVTPIDGQERFIAAQRLPHYPMIIGSSRIAKVALAAWREQTTALASATALLVAGVMVLLMIGARQVRDGDRLARSEAARLTAEEKARGERRLRTEYARFGIALDNMSQGLCLFDASARIVAANARLASLLGVPEELRRPGTPLEALLDRFRTRMTDREGERFTAALRGAAVARVPATLVGTLADDRIISVSMAPVPDGGFVCTFEDETERRRAEATIAHMAHHDALTGLPNRLLLSSATEQMLNLPARRRAGAMLLLDLDGFKQVNDVHGHPFGDMLLRRVSDRLRALMRPTDLLARLGGDEFAVVQDGGLAAASDNEQPAEALALAARISAALRAPFVIESTTVSIGTSIGVALADSPSCTPELLLRHADIALYRAKAEGRATWALYQPFMEREIHDRRALEQGLSHALAAGEFTLHYQPIVHAADGRVAGYEALLRWCHPVRGLVAPAEFIPLAEETGLICAIGAWCLEQACRDAAGWAPNLTVAVNLSSAQFKGGAILDVVARALRVSGLPPRRLELEITESVLLRDEQANLSILEELSRMGVRTAMDDFGTGYSSISTLRRFRFDKIKIDQSFVRNLFAGPRDVAILRAAVELGRALGVVVLAEGVETEDERAVLVAEGCHQLQGYFFGRPVPWVEIGSEEARDAA